MNNGKIKSLSRESLEELAKIGADSLRSCLIQSITYVAYWSNPKGTGFISDAEEIGDTGHVLNDRIKSYNKFKSEMERYGLFEEKYQKWFEAARKNGSIEFK